MLITLSPEEGARAHKEQMERVSSAVSTVRLKHPDVPPQAFADLLRAVRNDCGMLSGGDYETVAGA